MPLAAGSKIRSYDIVALLGAGGMGEVYRARDQRLGRDVAIKIVSPTIAGDADGLMRFEREARLLAALNHPNIAAIYGAEDHGDQPVLILELVEGETLADRIARGPIPVDEALSYARQIADALDSAHEAGIVHRDLKPGNIKITESGAVKVLDFGLAKAIAVASAPEAVIDPAQSPTVTVKGTRGGVILGTAAYMSPEQARGRAIDKRTDIWAFGCVLYEMLAGRRAFEGETTPDLIAAVIERQPDWTRLPTSIPPHVRRVIARCLEKDPKRRARDIGDVRVALDEDPVPHARPPSGRWILPAAVMLVALIGAAAVGWRLRGAPAGDSAVVLSLLPEPGTSLSGVSGGAAPSPDGRTLAFAARDRDGTSAVWLRALDSDTATRLDGTEGANGEVFWSPSGRDIGFVAGGRLKRIAVAGGPATSLAQITGGNSGASWNRDDVIVFAQANRTPLYRVSASGGEVMPLTTLDPARENSHRFPHFLPDGEHFLFTARSDRRENNLIYVGSLSSKTITPVRAAQSDAVYAPPGYLLFVDDGALMAQPFDLRSLTVSGTPSVVAPRVRHNMPSSNGFLGASADGRVVAHVLGEDPLAQPTWFDRSGTSLGTVGPARNYAEVRLSPDGGTAVVDIPDRESGTRELWLLDTTTAALSRLTSHPATDWIAAWSRDGSQIAFASDRAGASSVFRKRADGTGDDVLVYRGSFGAFPTDWSPDGRTLLAHQDRPPGGTILAISVADGSATPLLESKQAAVLRATYTPDGRWIAYESRETGTEEIYVSPVGRPGRMRVSVAGGTEPRWRADGRELFFVSASGDLMAAPVIASDPLRLAPPIKLFTLCASRSQPGFFAGVPQAVNATADGKRFLIRCADSPEASTSGFGVLLNWSSKLP